MLSTAEMTIGGSVGLGSGSPFGAVTVKPRMLKDRVPAPTVST